MSFCDLDWVKTNFLTPRFTRAHRCVKHSGVNLGVKDLKKAILFVFFNLLQYYLNLGQDNVAYNNLGSPLKNLCILKQNLLTHF